MKIGRSLREDRFDGEVVYYDRSAANQEQGRSYTSIPELMDAHGGWIASAGDLARFAGAFSDPANCPLLKEETIETMWAPQETNPSSVWYGLGWKVRGLGNERYNAWHGGLLLNCCSTIMVRLSDGTTWAVLFNTDTSAIEDLDNQYLGRLIGGWPGTGLYGSRLRQAVRDMQNALPQRGSP
jgi:N-acyl-D-amino-acid deacylase